MPPCTVILPAPLPGAHVPALPALLAWACIFTTLHVVVEADALTFLVAPVVPDELLRHADEVLPFLFAAPTFITAFSGSS